MKLVSAPEPLEHRIAPATLVSPTTVTYQDLDGDDVTLKFSKPILTDLAAANALLKFDTGTVVASAGNAAGQQLQLIDLVALAAVPENAGLGFTLTAKRNATHGGDGFADLGAITAAGLELGTVLIGGDLGRVTAGDVTGLGIKSLTVQSMGELGASTQASGGTLASSIAGAVGSFTVNGNLRDITFDLTGGTDSDLGTLKVGGSVVGANLTVSGSIASLKIGGDLRGGGTAGTGRIVATDAIVSAAITGSVVGTLSDTALVMGGTIGKLSVGGDLRGGSGQLSARLYSNDTFGSLTIGGSVFGLGIASAEIFAGADIGSVTIGGDIIGGASGSAAITSYLGAAISIKIGGSLLGSGESSAIVTFAQGIDSLFIGGSIRGGSGASSAGVYAGSESGNWVIGGSVVGYQGTSAEGEFSGLVRAPSLDSLKIGGSLIGGSAHAAGKVEMTAGGVDAVTIGGSIVGGGGLESGSFFVGSIVKMAVAGDIRGGAGKDSGSVRANAGELDALTVGGSVYSGSNTGSGVIYGSGGFSSLAIKGSLVGTAAHPAIISAKNNLTPDGEAFGKITIGGRVEQAQILAGYELTTQSNADAKIGSVTVGGDWIASSLAAGVKAGGDGRFGTADDALNDTNPAPDPNQLAENYVSRIGSVVIKGQALGTVGGTDGFGIASEKIGALKIGAVSKVLDPDALDVLPLGATGDFFARELGAAPPPTLTGTDDLTIVSPAVATWTDVDGDLVTLTVSKPVLDLAQFARVISGAGVQVQTINFSALDPAVAKGMTFTLKAKPQDVNGDGILDGDGFVNLGFLNAAGIDLGKVTVPGDLGRFSVGDSTVTTPALAGLTAQSLGRFGTSTQTGGSLLSTATSSIGALTILGDIVGAHIEVNGSFSGTDFKNGTLGKLVVKGSLLGGSVSGDGFIKASGSIGSVAVGGDLVGGAGIGTGRIEAFGTIGNVIVGGSVVGGAEDSGVIQASAGMKDVKIGRDIRGGTNASGADDSGVIDGTVKIGSVKIGGSIVGGSGEESGAVKAQDLAGEVKSVTIGGDLIGGSGEESGYVNALIKLGQVKIVGSLIGGGDTRSGFIYAGSAIVTPHTMAGVTIGGDMIGGAGLSSAALGSSFGQAGSIGDLSMGPVVIKGSLIGNGLQSASITANKVKSLTVGHNVIGGAAQSASLGASGAVSAIKIGGSLIGVADSSGSVFVGTLGALTIGHDLVGGSEIFSGSLSVGFGGAKSITVGGSVQSGTAVNSGSIYADSALASLTVKGNAWGTSAHHVQFAARGADGKAKPVALGKLAVSGSAEYLDVLGGYSTSANPFNGDAVIGAVTVSGTWRAGNIASGIRAGTDGFFATSDDLPSQLGLGPDFSKIASITIKGRALGTVGGSDGFGFAAEEIGAVKIGAVAYKLTKGPGNDNDPAQAALLKVGSTGDFAIRERPIAM